MKLGLALGGGGARGSAHIGVLYELFRLGLKPDVITGTSIGGIIGAMVAAQMPPEKIETVMRGLKPSMMYALPDGIPAIAATTNIKKYLNSVFIKHFNSDPEIPATFADLDLQLAVTATDLVTKREVILDEGDLISALLSTMSIPILFPPVKMGEKRLVDGGLMNNLPFDVARARGAMYIIAVDLGNAAPYGSDEDQIKPDQGILGLSWENLIDGNNLFDKAIYQATRDPLWQVVTTVIDIVNQQNTNMRLAYSPPDVLIRPNMGKIGILDFHTIDEGIAAGRHAVQLAAPQIEKLITNMARAKQEKL